MKRLIAGLALMFAAGVAPAQSAAPALQLWRLDCGDFVMKRFGAWFSDTFQYPPGARPLVGSCYSDPPRRRLSAVGHRHVRRADRKAGRQ